ncbi:MAG: FmdB family zinc ribbon protein [Bryobacteraceae bacterium]
MPLYEYQCAECGEVFELLRRADEADEPAECPRCGSEHTQRQLSLFSSSARGCSASPGRGFT